MPFKSEKQRKYLFANLPEVAEEFASRSHMTFKGKRKDRIEGKKWKKPGRVR